ncbi:efflux transporter periplasmic adaptor subunit [Enterovibrio norvegicus FF-33]|uniref:Efflux transporter periplasmic adaptor subunit n=2 Tax=Vibrionaceae TaxID=641 RepID=A0A1E5CF21_9GAMM|nr:efflux RND transporter periplasmic adaptor subunit [Enterovibrio norvegicus]OEE64108.1 efflux transporter periplasmic adaptor subunit [Enterovibrio norvegicus FF-454]OEE67026.1 efflux transporter periplasmic adaptor subunit [Enterovibrio norvegicus FF-33]OEE82411.1 efflux transporter periplasmic adaptor subunit [Enterovibrio norvegicus FF-162]
MKVTLIFACCFYLSGCSEEVSIPEPEARPAKLMTVSIGESNVERAFPGTVEADDQAVLAFRVEGKIIAMPVFSGEEVVEGSVLAELDKAEYLLLLEKAKSIHQLATVQYQRAVKLKKTNFISAQDFDKAVSSLNEAKASLELAQSNFNYTTLRAPYGGTVSLRVKEKFEFVNAMEPVMHIQTNEVINVSFQLPERLFNFFSSGGEANSHSPSVSFDAYPDQTFPAEFKEVDTEADTTTASYRITVSLPRPQGVNVLPGMAAEVSTNFPGSAQNTLPSSAIDINEGLTSVWRVGEGGKVNNVPIVLNGDVLESGLSDGDVIVVNGIQSLKNGMVVYPWVKERGL